MSYNISWEGRCCNLYSASLKKLRFPPAVVNSLRKKKLEPVKTSQQ